MRQTALRRAQRIIVLIIVVALAGIALLVAPLPALFGGARDGSPTAGGESGLLSSVGALFSQGEWRAAAGRQVALVSGHAGNDSGAVCEDDAGNVTLTEASVNLAVAERVAQQLRRVGADVTILDEFDPRLENLRADLLLSIHADSCIDASGYKAASHALRDWSEDDRLVACIDHYYPAITGLPHHPNTVTHNMTEYHAFKRISQRTPAAILELGFLGGDGAMLENRPDLLADAIGTSLLCFLRGEDPLAPVEAPPSS